MTDEPNTVTQELMTAMGAIMAINVCNPGFAIRQHAGAAESAIGRALHLIQHLRCETVAQFDRL